jgi:hypothetical protein
MEKNHTARLKSAIGAVGGQSQANTAVGANGGTTMVECCMTCAKFDEEWEYCWRFGNHAPKDGKCDEYKPKENDNEHSS